MKRVILAASALLFAASSIADTQWRKLDPENTVLMTLPHGKVVIELAPEFTPNHVARFKQLAQSGFYQGNKFYRVIDGFVAQAGPKDGSKKDKSVTNLKMESEWQIDDAWSYTEVQSPAFFAPTTGFKKGFALGLDKENKKAWLTHCPGVIAMARGNEPDTGSSHFYIVNGQAPRYLDRIMAVFGRVVYGMNHVQSITRTAGVEGEQPLSEAEMVEIVDIQLMSDVKPENRIEIEVEDTDNKAFADKVQGRKYRTAAFFYKKPPPVLDVCQVPVKSRLIVAK